MSDIPRSRPFDMTLPFLSTGYTFISDQCRELDTDAFETRLMLRKTLCILGEDGARMFFHPDRFTRKGAIPPTAMLLLQDRNSVQSLSGSAHRHRKGMFMRVLSPTSIESLVTAFSDAWRTSLDHWWQEKSVVLHTVVEEVLCRAAMQWAGIPFTVEDAVKRTREFSAMIEGAGAIGPRNWRGLLLRIRTERWAQQLIQSVRDGSLNPPPGSALSAVALHRDESGTLINQKVAGVELLNILRPVVAVARFITFGALALHEYPEHRERVSSGDDLSLEHFVQEVRRFYPFFPVLAGIARTPFEWRNRPFRKGTMVVMDLYGTNHDARIWGDPERFRPARFHDWDSSPYNFIPQGGGDVHTGHRCPGEQITIELTKSAMTLLSSEMRYTVPAQDLHIDLSRFPSIPRSRFVITHVKAA